MINEHILANLGMSPEGYNDLSDSEKATVDQVLQEIANGNFDVFDELYYTDYDEIPVDFTTFISDDRYLGKSTRNGQFLYPFWKKEIPRILKSNSSEVALSGSIGVGKSTVAVLTLIYHLYRTMCMKNPQEFFGLAPGTKIEYAFLNNTLSSSYGVAYQAFQAFIQESPWFLKHGKVTGRNYTEYVPEKGFGFIVGSKPQHTLGRAIIGAVLDEVSFAPGQNVSYEKCLTGDTIIRTTEGDYEIKDLVGKTLRVYNYSPEEDKDIISNECTVVHTMDTSELVEIELEDNTVIKCTPFHRLMLKNGSYKMVKDLTEDDELMEVMKIKSITRTTYDKPVPVYDVINAFPYNNFYIKTKDSYIVSHNSRIMDTYTNIRRRMESRFMVQGKNYGLLFLVSSKATESSFLEAYIADQVRKGYPIYVVDQPLWKVKPAAYSGEMFKVAVGNKYVRSRVSPVGLDKDQLDNWIDAAKKSGLSVIDVPVEHRQAFDQNLDKALQDIAGISTSVVTKAFSVEKVMQCVSSTLHNPFSTDVITTGLNDDLKLQDFFLPSEIPDNVLSAPIFIHLDASLTGDRTGLSGVAIVGTKEQVMYSTDIDEKHVSEELLYQQVFTIGIQAPGDSEISLEKTRQFIYYLKDDIGLNIKCFSADGFQSRDTMQILSTKGYNTKYISLDRTPDGYDSLRSALYDKRMILLQGCDLLIEELSELERDNMTRKYDHTAYSSKDSSDSLAGALLSASQHKDEYMFFAPSEYEYEDINDNISLEDKEISNMVASALGSHLAEDSMRQLFRSRDSIPGYDDNIFIL